MTAEPSLAGLSIRHCVAEADVAALGQVLPAHGFEVLRLDGAEIRDRAGLFAATREQLLSDDKRCGSWDDWQMGLEELLWSSSERVALIWSGAHQMLGAGLCDLLMASDVLASVSRSLYAAEVVFVVFLCGDGPGFPAMNAAWRNG
jgi:hypothetical protein